MKAPQPPLARAVTLHSRCRTVAVLISYVARDWEEGVLLSAYWTTIVLVCAKKSMFLCVLVTVPGPFYQRVSCIVLVYCVVLAYLEISQNNPIYT